MVEEGLKVRFVGEDQSLGKTSGDAAKSLDNVAKASTNATTALKTQATVSQQASAAAARMAQTAAQSGGAIAGTTRNFTGLTRVIQDLPFGFIAISNNLEQLLPAAGGLGLAFSAVVAAISFAQVGLSNWTRGLSGSKDSVDQNTEAMALFGRELESVKQDLDSFTESLDYANKLGKIRVDIAFGKGLKADLIDLRSQSIGNLTLTSELEKEGKRVESIATQIRENLINQLAEPGNEKLFEAFDKGILESVEDLPEKIKKTYDRLKDAEKQQVNISDQIIKARQNQSVLYAQIEQKKIDIQEDANKKAHDAAKKAQQDDEKSRRETLQRLKQYQEERARIISEFSKDFGELKIFTLPDVGDPQNNKELFDRLQKRLIEESGRQIPIKIKLPVDVSIEQDFKTGKINITERLKEIQAINPAKVPIPLEMPFDIKNKDKFFAEVGEVLEKEGEKFAKAGFKLPPIDLSNITDPKKLQAQLEAVYDQTQKQAQLISSTLTPAFESMFSAIESGGNALQAFGKGLVKAMEQVIAQLIEEAAIAAVISAVIPGAGSFTSIFKALSGLGALPGHKTGLWSVPKDDYVARLHKNEMVVPAGIAGMLRSSDLITPSFTTPGFNSQVTAASTTQGTGGIASVRVVGRLTAHGRELKAVLVQEDKSQGRAF